MSKQLEERVADLEAEVIRLKKKVDKDSSNRAWWKQITGTFANNPAYDEAMRLGHEYRESLRPSSQKLSNE